MRQLKSEPAQNYEVSNCRPCRNVDISGNVLQFLCISLRFQDRVAQMLPRQGAWIEWKFYAGRLSYSIHQKCAPCAHSPRTHRALTAHSKNGVMWPRGPWSSISSMRPWEHLVHGFRVSFYTLWEDARNQNWSPGSASIQRFYSDLHGLRGCQATELTPCKCPHSMFLLRFTHFERMLGDTIESLRVPPSMFILCLRFESIPGNKIHSLGMPSFNVSIAFHMLWEGAVAENWFPGSGHIQCFYCSCFQRILGNKADSLGVPTFYFIVFYMFWEDAG